MQTFFEAETGPLFAADFDYFRLPREKWELMLTRLKQMGSNSLLISLPWAWHEIEAGVFDLNGQSNPRRDLLGLLSLCQALELRCILDTGPLLNKGIGGQGIPLWQITQGGDFGESLVEGLTGWYTRLVTDLKPAQWPNGPVVALIVDNGFVADRPPKLATELTEVKWPIWLRKQYKGIEAINQAYGTSYRTVSRVEFPETWGTEATPLDRDAKAFLDEMQVNLQPDLARILAGPSWAGPIYDIGADKPVDLPAIRRVDLSSGLPISEAIEKSSVLHLQNPIEIYPDPIDIGQGPIWAENAPVRPDGSVRQKFWQVRQALWPHHGSDFAGDGPLLTLSDNGNLVVTSSRDEPLRVDTTLPAKAAVYSLGLDGRLQRTDRLKISRKKLTGTYVTEDDRGQVDLVIGVGNKEFSADGFLAAYLRSLLRGQHQSLSHCAEQAATLAEMLTLDDASTPPAPSAETPPAPRRPTSYVLEEARRGLSEADAALRKAVASIGGLEGGFAKILEPQKPTDNQPRSATGPVPITPAAFDGLPQEIMVKVGKVCLETSRRLSEAATSLDLLAETTGLTIAKYQQGQQAAVNAAQSARELLLDVIAELRREINSERLPLIMWRVHDQVQAMAENLRWGVLRG